MTKNSTAQTCPHIQPPNLLYRLSAQLAKVTAKLANIVSLTL